MKKTKINIGSGRRPRANLNNEWIDLDIRQQIRIGGRHYTPGIVADCRKIPSNDNAYSLVYAHSVLEHFSKHDRMACLKEWHRVCKTGGRVWISVPDMVLLAKALLIKPTDGVINFIYGEQNYPENTHRWGYTQNSIRTDLIAAGFKNVRFYKPTSYDFELIVEADK